jgi:VWD domain-containing protein
MKHGEKVIAIGIGLTLLSNSLKKCFGGYLGILVGAFLAVAPWSLAASAQPDAATSPSVTPSDQEREDFHKSMSRIPLPRKGCFVAQYPSKTWQEVPCVSPPSHPNGLTGTVHPFTVGNGADFFAQVTGNISSATGSFDSVTGLTDEWGSRNGNLAVVFPDTYMMQLNANTFSTPACGAVPACFGWQQFFLDQNCTDNTTHALVSCIYMQYWLFNLSSCPTGWTTFAGDGTSMAGCFRDSPGTIVSPTPTLADLALLRMTGTATSGGMDTILLSTPNGNVTATANDSMLNLGSNWTTAEFNVLGDCCASTAFFNAKQPGTVATFVVRLNVNNGTTNAPTCASSSPFHTTETNNLDLGSCSEVGGASPAIVFTESGGGALPSGVSFGDTHLTTFFGAHYDFQASGEFVLVQADPGLVVQTRQKSWNPPNVSVNIGVGIRMGGTRVAVCLTGLTINGAKASLGDGQSLSLVDGVNISRAGNTYVVSRPSGDNVNAEISGNVMNVSVALGATNPNTLRGLLGGLNHGDRKGYLIMRDGRLVNDPMSASDFRSYADSWRVDPADSLLCDDGKVKPGMPTSAIYASDLPKQEQERVRGICLRTGVKPGPLLNDCMLDVSMLGYNSAADVFVHAPSPTKVLIPGP